MIFLVLTLQKGKLSPLDVYNHLSTHVDPVATNFVRQMQKVKIVIPGKCTQGDQGPAETSLQLFMTSLWREINDVSVG